MLQLKIREDGASDGDVLGFVEHEDGETLADVRPRVQEEVEGIRDAEWRFWMGGAPVSLVQESKMLASRLAPVATIRQKPPPPPPVAPPLLLVPAEQQPTRTLPPPVTADIEPPVTPSGEGGRRVPREGEIFISYSHRDAAFVRWLREALVRAGFGVWFDELQLESGCQWNDEVAQAVQRCRVLIFCVSATAVSSKYCLEEFNFAYDEDKDICPCWLVPPADVKLKPGLNMRLRKFQWTYFHPPEAHADALARLLAGLRRLTAPDMQSPTAAAISQPHFAASDGVTAGGLVSSPAPPAGPAAATAAAAPPPAQPGGGAPPPRREAEEAPAAAKSSAAGGSLWCCGPRPRRGRVGVAEETARSDPLRLRARQTFTVEPKSKVYAIDWNPAGTHLLAACQAGRIYVWAPATSRNPIKVVPLRSSWVMAVAASGDDRLCASGGLDNTVTLHQLNLDSRDPPAKAAEIAGHDGYVSSLRFVGPSGARVLSGSGDSTAVLWDVETRAAVAKFAGHTGDVMSAVPSPVDENAVATGACDATVRLWDVRAPQAAVARLEGHESDVNAVRFAWGGAAVASASDDSTVRVWDARKTDAEHRRFDSPRILCGVTSVAFARSDEVVYAGYDDYNIVGWSRAPAPAGGEGAEGASGRMEGHQNRVSCLSASSLGDLASGSWDADVKIWR